MKSKAVIKKQTPLKKKATPEKITPVEEAPSHIISKSEGAGMVQNFTDKRKNLSKIIFSRAIQFDKSLFENLLKLKGVKKIRIYNAINGKGEHTFVVTAVDGKLNDIYFKTNSLKTKTQLSKLATAPDAEGVGNMGSQCPEYMGDIKIL